MPSRLRPPSGRASAEARPRHPRPPIITFGTGGSGTRAIAEILREAGVYLGAELNRASDSRPLTRFLRTRAPDYIAASGWIQALERDPAGADVAPPTPDLAAEFAATLERQREAIPSADSMWGWKNPPTVYLLPLVHSVVPDALTVQLVRDGRDMAYSQNQNQLGVYGELLLADLEGAPEPVRSIALWSRVNLATLAYARRFIGQNHLVLRYEDLCEDPAGHGARLLAHLGIPASPELLSRAGELITPSRSVGRWRSAPSEEVEAVQEAGAAGLREFGYV